MIVSAETKIPLIVDLKRNSLDDGPGIRSVVFFKGCPLRCVWCQNPEALLPLAEIQRDSEKCVGCLACAKNCAQQLARSADQIEDRTRCQMCLACVEACPTGARRVAGKPMGVEELAKALLRDEPFYRNSQGGVTFSGGEPTLYPKFVGEVAELLRKQNISVLLETCGHFDWDGFSQHLLPHVSTIYFDLKLADPEQHRRLVGLSNDRILANLKQLVKTGFVDLLPRVPLVPGITATEENLSAIARIILELGLSRLALLPYNPLWLPKRKSLGLEMTYQHGSWMSREEIDACREIFIKGGLSLYP